jgi:membrane-associated phospholipid phosphatase
MNEKFIEIWKQSLNDKRFRYTFLIQLSFLVILLVLFANFLNFVEARKGFSFDDPLLVYFQPIDLTWLTFALIYITLFTSVYILSKHPIKLLIGIMAYCIMISFRIIAMFLLPLEPPAEMIPLADPLVEILGTGQLLTKDLFFSGHTATMFLFALVVPKLKQKIIIFSLTAVVGISVILQHVHYTIDVFVAPFFAYVGYKAAEFIVNKYIMKKAQ